jgi:hypothetical protein
LTWRIGEGTGSVVELIVALPKAFVGTPSLLGENPASVMFTTSAPWAGPADRMPAQQTATPASIRKMGTFDLLSAAPGARWASALRLPVTRPAQQ